MKLSAWWQSLSPNEKAAFIAYPGVVFTGLVAIGIAIYNKRSNSKPPVRQTPAIIQQVTIPPSQVVRSQAPRPQNALDLRPSDIIKRVEAATPFNQKQIQEQFVGNIVAWDLPLSGVNDEGQDIYRVILKTESIILNVICRVPSPQNAFLRVCPKGELLNVVGTIESVQGLWITLKDVTISHVG